MKAPARIVSTMLERLARCRRGVSTVEFAMVAPVFLLILGGVVDLGGSLQTKARLDAAVSASANYVLINADKVNATNGASLIANAGALIAGGLSDGSGNVSVTINNGLSFNYADGVATASGGTGSADQCFCPQMSAGAVTWGSAVACATACPSGSQSGKFVTITVSQSHAPLFAGLGVVGADGRIAVRTIVQPQ